MRSGKSGIFVGLLISAAPALAQENWVEVEPGMSVGMHTIIGSNANRFGWIRTGNFGGPPNNGGYTLLLVEARCETGERAELDTYEYRSTGELVRHFRRPAHYEPVPLSTTNGRVYLMLCTAQIGPPYSQQSAR